MSTEDVNRAFNEGCDARIAGTPVQLNPYNGENQVMGASWTRGWKDVHMYWGSRSKDRVQPLQRVRNRFS